MVRAVQEHRPHAKVAIVTLDELEAEVKRLDPQLVIFCGRPDLAEALGDEVPSWVRLSQHPERPWRIRVGERRWELLNPTLEELVSVLDETERLLRKTRRRGGSAASSNA